MKVIRCDCGFEASENDAANLVSLAEKHARDVHHSDLPPELVRVVAGASIRSRPEDATECVRRL